MANRTPHFLQRLPGSGFFREGILRGNNLDTLIEFLGTFGIFIRADIHMANVHSQFCEFCICICSCLFFFVFFCSWLPGP